MTSPTLDCLNQDRAPRLEDLILAEVFLAGGPCYIHRLWSEMFERQKSISVGSLIFTREVMRLEQDGLLREIDGNRTAITKQGEVHLFGLVLLGMIPDEQKRRLESKGVGQVLSVDGVPHGLVPSLPVTAAGKVAGEQDSSAQPQATPYDREPNLLTVRPSRPAEILGVALQGAAGVSVPPSPPFPSDDRFAGNISRFVDRRMQ